jgi:hypothetical protein
VTRPRYRKDLGGDAELVWLPDEEELPLGDYCAQALSA